MAIAMPEAQRSKAPQNPPGNRRPPETRTTFRRIPAPSGIASPCCGWTTS